MKLANGIIFYTEDEVKRYSFKTKKRMSAIVGLNNGIDVLPIKRLRKSSFKFKIS